MRDLAGLGLKSLSLAFRSIAELNRHAIKNGVFNGHKFLRSAREYERLWRGPHFQLAISNLDPYVSDFGTEAGCARGQYFFQDLWAARKIATRKPALHIDIGSRLDGFVSHLLVFMPVTVLDIRPLTSTVEGLTFKQSDATNLSEYKDASVDSISSLHAIEHFGLGRYGDPIDPTAWEKAMRSLCRVLSPSGRLIFLYPSGENVCASMHTAYFLHR